MPGQAMKVFVWSVHRPGTGVSTNKSAIDALHANCIFTHVA